MPLVMSYYLMHRLFILILTRNNGSELKTVCVWGLSQEYAWGITMTVHLATACLLCLYGENDS